MIRKLGLVLECDAGGPDELVFKCLVRRLSPETTVVVRALGNKPAVIRNGAEVAQALVEADQCDLVLIVWDLKPLWEKPGSCQLEADILRENLLGVPERARNRIRLLCLTYELETWLIAEAAVIREYLSTSAHRCDWRGVRSPEGLADAKATLNTVFTRFRGPSRRYVDYQEAIRISSLWATTRRLLKVKSFQRFCELLTGRNDAEFVQPGDVCGDLCYHASRMGR